MASRTAEINGAREAILRAMAELGGAQSPVRLISYLVGEGLSEDVVRAALWYLLDQKELALTSDWLVKPPSSNGHKQGIEVAS